jgi:hypothetical protein
MLESGNEKRFDTLARFSYICGLEKHNMKGFQSDKEEIKR